LRLEQSAPHRLVAGATGTGKTVTLRCSLRLLADGLPLPRTSKATCQASPRQTKQGGMIGVRFVSRRVSTARISVRRDVRKIGIQCARPNRSRSLLLASLVGRDTQAACSMRRSIADEQGCCARLKDLKALLAGWSNTAPVARVYGSIAAASVGAIRRGVLVREEQGADRCSANRRSRYRIGERFAGSGVVTCSTRHNLQTAPRVYAARCCLADVERSNLLKRRRRTPEARAVLRRSAPVVQRRAEAAGRQDRTGGALIGSKGVGVLRVAEPARYSGRRVVNWV
jgi:hypothetical protein